MRIAVCEDEWYWVESIVTHIELWGKKRSIDVSCALFNTGEELLSHIEENTIRKYDLIFMDIMLAGAMDGMQLSYELHTRGYTVPIVFTSSYASRANEGYYIDAMGFLVKPFSAAQIEYYLEKALTKMRDATKHVLKIETDQHMLFIKERDIVYAEVINHTVTLHTTNGHYSYRKSLTELLQELSVGSFIQIHRAIVVSVAKIKSLKTTRPYSVEIEFAGEQKTLNVSRSYFDALQNAYTSMVLGRLPR